MFRSPMIGMALAAAALGGCTTPQEPARPWASQDGAGRDDQPVHRLAGYEAHFVLGWNGARIGDALESLRRHGSGLRFERRERISLSRGGAVVHSDTAIIIDTDLELRATSIVIRQISGDSEVRGRADRGPRGQWLVRYDDEPARELPAAAVPAELVPLLVRSRDGAGARQPGFSGPVILAGYGFAVASLGMSVMDEHTVLAVLETRHGVMRGRFWFTQGGTVARVEADDGSSARRVSAEEAGAAFDPPEVLEPTIVPIANAGAGDPVSFVIGPVERALPPPLPGQRIEVDMDTWRVHLDAGDVHPPPVMGRESGLGRGSAGTAGAISTERPARSNESVDRLARSIAERARARRPRDQIMPLARATADLLQDDLGSPVTGARAALALGRGDCTAHAVLFASLAGALDIEARLVTGYRVDGGRLVRHRWAIAAIDGAWIAVDPTFGEAPAAARLLGLAIHDVSAADMALADELAFAGFGRAHARALAQ